MRVVFMGTPEFATYSLQTLIDMPVEIVGVFTQPDRPVGRGHKLEAPPVKQLAEKHGLPVFQFERVKRPEGLEQMRALEPDLVVTAAFGQILSKALLDVPKMGTINVHASLLPRHRGAAPINWSIIQGEKVTGVTTMLTDVGMDTGDMLLRTETEIGFEETAGELTERLAKIGAELLRTTIEKYAAGEITPVKQDEDAHTYEPMLSKELGRVDWTKTAQEIHNLVRGVNPWPGAFTEMGADVLKIWKTLPCEGGNGVCGSVIASSAKDGLKVACGNGTALEILELQLPGGKRMSAKAYLAGKKMPEGMILGAENGFEKD